MDSTPKSTGPGSARRALRVFKALRGHALTGLSNKELADAVGDSPVNVCRALEALEAEGLALRLDDGRWAHSVWLLQTAEHFARETESALARIHELRQRVAAGAR
ncbi:hypothetical protein [Desulfocurvus vexinensis]|uniref:hypothetical protein n=1 Tax=Desulfocurvus vexinensis TaxID=399548 RepID=UPI00048CA8A6|nr:hypothetical protein [Desulfocurvus vexinensis]